MLPVMPWIIWSVEHNLFLNLNKIIFVETDLKKQRPPRQKKKIAYSPQKPHDTSWLMNEMGQAWLGCDSVTCTVLGMQ